MRTSTDDGSAASLEQISATGRRLLRRGLTIGGNRLELLAIELQEEREHLLHAVMLALGVAVLGLLSAMTLTAVLVVWLWAYSHIAVLLCLTFIYGAGAAGLGLALGACVRGWQNFPASLEQLHKDRACLEKILE